MPRDVNETIVNIDHDKKVASIWTCNRRILNKMRRMRAKEGPKQAGGAWFELPEKGISFRKPRKKASPDSTRPVSEGTVPESHETDGATSD